MTAISLWIHNKLSPYLRGSLYFAVLSAAMSVFVSYINVAYIERGITGVQIGTLTAVGSVISVVTSPLLTNLSDRKNWHVLYIFLSNFLFGFSIIMINFSPTFAILLGWSTFGGIVRSPANPIANGLIVRMANKYHLNFGQMRVWGSISFILFSILAGWLWDQIGLEWLFWIGGGFFIFRAFMAILLDPVDKDGQPDEDKIKPNGTKNWLLPLKDHFFLIYLAGIVLWGCAMSGYNSYISVYLNQLAGGMGMLTILVLIWLQILTMRETKKTI